MAEQLVREDPRTIIGVDLRVRNDCSGALESDMLRNWQIQVLTSLSRRCDVAGAAADRCTD